MCARHTPKQLAESVILSKLDYVINKVRSRSRRVQIINIRMF